MCCSAPSSLSPAAPRGQPRTRPGSAEAHHAQSTRSSTPLRPMKPGSMTRVRAPADYLAGNDSRSWPGTHADALPEQVLGPLSPRSLQTSRSPYPRRLYRCCAMCARPAYLWPSLWLPASCQTRRSRAPAAGTELASTCPTSPRCSPDSKVRTAVCASALATPGAVQLT